MVDRLVILGEDRCWRKEVVKSRMERGLPTMMAFGDGIGHLEGQTRTRISSTNKKILRWRIRLTSLSLPPPSLFRLRYGACGLNALGGAAKGVAR